MTYIDFNDPKVPLGKRKVAYVKWAMSKGTSEKQARIQANKKFGFVRKGKWIARIGNADCMDLPSFRDFTWADAACGAGCPDPRRCESVIIVCDCTYSSFDICDGFDIVPRTWIDTPRRDLPTWENCEEWARVHGYKLGHINWLTP